MAAHFTGLIDFYTRREADYEVLPDKKPRTVWNAHKQWLRKAVPYYAKEYGLFPLLAGPFFWKVALGNWLAETLRSVYSAATIFTGHVGEQTSSYAEGTKATSRARWYAMQAESANDFEVPHALSVLCGGLDKQIEHHLFPKLPPRRLRQIAPEVRAICERHGIRYQTGSWPSMLGKVFRQLRRLGKPAVRAEQPTKITRASETTRHAA